MTIAFFLSPTFLHVLKWVLLFDERKGLTVAGHPLPFLLGGNLSGYSLIN
jgi:hypothetical protein